MIPGIIPGLGPSGEFPDGFFIAAPTLKLEALAFSKREGRLPWRAGELEHLTVGLYQPYTLVDMKVNEKKR
jgi:hypothetical protein